EVDPSEVGVPAIYPDVPLVREDIAGYYMGIQRADARVGAMLRALEDSGRLAGSIIMFVGDQGMSFHRAKSSLYHLGQHVPAAMWVPGGPAGQRRIEFVSHVDYAPTLLDLAGLDVPATMQGHSLRPLLEGRESVDWRGYVVSEHNAHDPNPETILPQRTVIGDRFQYIRNYMPERRYTHTADQTDQELWKALTYRAVLESRDEWPEQYAILTDMDFRPMEELYDLHTDPAELRNLALDDRYAFALNDMRGKLEDWQREFDDVTDPEYYLHFRRRDASAAD
ncbi:MAG: sulfatase-like hydrolase/transferase, partial [Armatimonadia bacterium]|nr:sulfatase-like hydrolase/transferase [Armatimonadia bacterium]